LATLITTPAFIAFRTSEAPFSSFRWANSADASRTAAGASASASATAAALGLVSLFLGTDLGSPVCDQLVGQTNPWSQVGKHPASPLYCSAAPFDRGFFGFCRLSHALHSTTELTDN